MSGVENVSEQIQRQYTSLYGKYHPGVFLPGDRVLAEGVPGEVIWSWMSEESGMVYMVVCGNDWPASYAADEIIAE